MATKQHEQALRHRQEVLPEPEPEPPARRQPSEPQTPQISERKTGGRKDRLAPPPPRRVRGDGFNWCVCVSHHQQQQFEVQRCSTDAQNRQDDGERAEHLQDQ